MECVKLGRTGLDVSRLCLGCMSYGVPERGMAPWSLNEEQSRPFIRKGQIHWSSSMYAWQFMKVQYTAERRIR